MTNQEAFKSAVKAQINGDVKHGWGVEDSLMVALAVVANENGADARDYGEEFKALIKKVINPSQFRQSVEGTQEEIDKGKALLLKGESRKRVSTAEIENWL